MKIRSLPIDEIRSVADSYFWPRVEKSEGCWLWRGWINVNGRPIATFNQRDFFAYRVAYALCVGCPDGLCVCHHCDNPICVRPDHLFLGTPGDNNRDMWEKGRGKPPIPSRGEAQHCVTVSDADVARARELYLTGAFTQEGLAQHFSVGLGTMRDWLTGRFRADAGGPISRVGPGNSPTKRPKPCSEDGCDQQARARGLCMHHYGRAYRAGRWVGDLS